MTDFAVARLNMVESQVRTNKVSDERLLSALKRVPREIFVPGALRGIAYVDEDLKVAPGRYLLEPMVLARLLQIADIASTDKLIEIGTATGYGAAIAANMAETVYALDCDPMLVETARHNLAMVGAGAVHVVSGELPAGYVEGAPYDVILVSGAVPDLPSQLAEQLTEGGRLLSVERAAGAAGGRGMLYVRRRGVVSGRPVFDAASRPLPGFAVKAEFAF